MPQQGPDAAKSKETFSKKPYVTTNQKTNYNRYIHGKEKGIQTWCKIVIKSQGKREEEERSKKELKNNPKQSTEGHKNTTVSDYFKRQWTIVPNQKTD